MKQSLQRQEKSCQTSTCEVRKARYLPTEKYHNAHVGLEPNEVRDAMIEFHKFDLEGDGWMDKAVLLPVLKACFTYTLPEPEIRALLSSSSLSSMVRDLY